MPLRLQLQVGQITDEGSIVGKWKGEGEVLATETALRVGVSAPSLTWETSLGLLKQTCERGPGCWKPGEMIISLWPPVLLLLMFKM